MAQQLSGNLAQSSTAEQAVAPVASSLQIFSEDLKLQPSPSLSFTIRPSVMIVVFWAFIMVACYIKDRRPYKPMPPGPPTKPFVGNKFDLGNDKPPWYKFKDWTDIYGDLITVWEGRRPTIVIGDPQVAHDLLNERASKYSSRPRFVVMGELYTNNDSLVTMPHGQKFKKMRKLFNKNLNGKECLESYQPIQDAESVMLLKDILDGSLPNPSKEEFVLETSIDRFTASIMTCISYGRRIEEPNDELILEIRDRMQYMATLNVPGKYWANTWPFLSSLPDFISPWKRRVKGKAEEATKMLTNLSLAVRTRMELPDPPASFNQKLWKDKAEMELSEREIAYATGSLFGAGADTTAATLLSFMLAMVCFPEAAKKAQEELDCKVGRDRMPTWEDMRKVMDEEEKDGEEKYGKEKSKAKDYLPYCQALIKEVLRWRPVAVMGGTPHASLTDDVYKGHFIPAGSTIVGNLWAIHHNEKYFSNPHEFIPERHLGLQDGVEKYPGSDGHSAFGWGGRKCPGQKLAENTIFIAITRILWAFNISKEIDSHTGLEKTYDINKYTIGINVRPEPFKCVIKPRFEGAAAIIKKKCTDVEGFLQKYEQITENSTKHRFNGV
ncbi:cytochrome P450 [Pyronema omphalodes]|nr:cytochrome P450 [Pyronema omphalodes]